MRRLLVFIFVSSLLLLSCVHQEPKSPKTLESFRTLIRNNGEKQFSYTLVVELPKNKDPSEIKRKPKGPPGEKPSNFPREFSQDPFINFFDDRLNEKINSTQFCRTGFKQLDRQLRLGAYPIKALCLETATEADREKFPNPPLKKVKEEIIE